MYNLARKLYQFFVFIIFEGKSPQGTSSCPLYLRIYKLQQFNKRGDAVFNPECTTETLERGYNNLYKKSKICKQVNLTRVLMLAFSCARLVIASAALLITPLSARELPPFLYCFNKLTRWGKAPVSTMIC